jgi:protocatechuate 3,4-dioxygenase beta subunit
MRFPARPAFIIVLMLGAMLSAGVAQTTPKPGTGIITGRVSLGDKAAANITVALLPMERNTPQRATIAKATTDYEGHYRLMNIPAGRYNVMAIAPAMVGPSEGMYGESGKTVTIAEGETVEKIDFSLVKGGVITGRVTDADGAPVISERIHLNQADKQAQNRGGRGFFSFNPFMYETDDRGIYRIYGIPAGRYTVSVGESTEEGSVSFGYGGRRYYTRTFHPTATEESKATIIEIGAGSEATNVDISLGRKAKSFVATGRVTDESGKPVVGARIGNGSVAKDGNRMESFGWGSISDSKGEFRLDGLLPGRYAAFVWSEADKDSYSDTARFEITDGNISGLELKLHSGSSISGIAVIEGTNDRTTLAKLSQFSLAASINAEGLAAPTYANVKISPDGSFRIKGLRPGKARIFLSTRPALPGFTLARVEREGIPVREIEITPGAQVTGIRAIIEYGSGSVRGLVKVENGMLPEEARVLISARRRGDTAGPANRGAQVDSRGRFLIEGMTTGEYELTLQVFIPGTPPRRIAPIKQNVAVTNGVEAEVTLVIDMNAKQPEGDNNE